jgi:hypothetical protein
VPADTCAAFLEDQAAHPHVPAPGGAMAAEATLVQHIRAAGRRGLSALLPSMAGMPTGATHGSAGALPWEILRAHARAATAGLPPVPEPGPGVCVCCRGPARRGFARCFHCGLHAESAPGLLADAVAPVACAPKGSRLATDLWVYKSDRAGAPEARGTLLAMLLVFLHDEGRRVWPRAGVAPPTCACVVPSGRGRRGPHPLQALVHGCLALPWVTLLARPGADTWGRMLDPGRFRAPRPLTGAAVLLLDDTWTSGGTAQSAAVALKRAGARSVTVVVVGRHLPAITNAGGEERARPAPAGQ